MDTQQLKEPLQIFQTFTELFSTHSNKPALNETKTNSTQQKCLELFIQTASTSGTSKEHLGQRCKLNHSSSKTLRQ